MDRLTVNKSISEMGMYELAHNCCYVKDGAARYRDFDTNIDARAFARNLMVEYGHWMRGGKFSSDADIELVDDDIFDETMLENLIYDPKESIGLIALFYRNLWAMADLRERLKEYEDLEELGLLLKLPCKVGDTVYTNTSMQGWYFRKGNRPYEAKIVFIGINGADNFINVDFGNGHMLQFKFSEIGKTVFLTQAEAEEALKGMEGENEK